jgi:hypothetical protein
MNAPSTRRPFVARHRWPLLIAVVLLVAVATIGLLIVRPWAGPSTSWSATIWAEITSGITDGQVPKQVALEAFAYDYRVTIPGVVVPVGRDGGDAPTSGSGVVRWVQAHWTELTPGQQAVIDPLITPGPNDEVSRLDLGADVGPTVLPVARPGDAIGVAAVDLPLRLAAVADLTADLQHLGPKLGLPTISSPSYVRFSDDDGGNVLMLTQAEGYAGVYVPCFVTVYSNAWSGEQAINGKVSDRLHVLLTHEAVHCYQNAIAGSVATAAAMPSWIAEGTAEWLAGDDTGIEQPNLAASWGRYFGEPYMALTNRTYDAVGYYALLDHLGRNLWALMAPAWQAVATAAAAGANPDDPFLAVLTGDAPDVRDAWAPSLLRRGDWGGAWVAYGFDMPVNAHAVPVPIEALDTGTPGTLVSRSNDVDQVAVSFGEIVTVETTGIMSAHDDAGNEVLSVQSAQFCTVESCVCKPGTARAGEDLASQQMRLPITLAFNAPEGGSTYVVTGKKLDDECGQASPPPSGAGPGSGGSLGSGSASGGSSGSGPGPEGSPCAGGCAGSNGDPHLTTVDGHRYDFQAAGEFTLLRSPDGSLEIQGRQEPWAGSDHLSVNTAIAARVGSHRVGIYADGDLLQVRIDGTLTKVTSPVDIGSGGRIIPYALGYEIDFPDGTTLWAMSVGNWGINAQIRPSTALLADSVGMLGPVPPSGRPVPALPDGTPLPATTDGHVAFVNLYNTLADAWRVTDASSLFDYQPGDSTATFTKPGFPSETTAVTLADLSSSDLAAGRQACASITDPALQDECAFDVATTGQAGFSSAYQVTQAFDATGPVALASTPPSVPAGPTVAPPPAGFTELLSDIQTLIGQVLAPDGTLYLSVELPDNSYVIVSADPKQGQIERQVTAAGGGPVTVASGSVWVGETTADGACSIVRLDPASLATQATISIPCFFGSPTFASLGQSIWFIDPTSMDTNLAGAVLRQIDPATNTPSAIAAPITYGGGSLFTGTGSTSIVYGYSQDTLFMPVSATSFQSLGPLESPLDGVSRGVWTWTSDPGSATLTGPTGPLATIPIDGSMIGADDQAVYTAGGPGSAGTDTLWRYPADGSAPSQIATGSKVGTAQITADLGYFDDWPFLIGPHAAVKLWLPTSRTDHLNDALDLQWIALP